jgi:aminopeptidase N
VRLHAASLLYGGKYTITLEFTGKVQDTMHGVYVCNYELNGKQQQLVASQFESHHAREAFPCIDEPEAKATFDLTLLSPLEESVLSNTPVQSQVQEDGKLKTTFETTPKMSTYLLAFVYGDMQSKETKTKNGVLVRVWSTRAHNIDALDFGLDVARRGIEFFEEYYGVPYPLKNSDHVALPDFSVGAMENWGLITYRETCLLSDPTTSSLSGRQLISEVILHELSHQWFGNLVTMKWWDDLWLNESFANVMAYVAMDGLFPQWHAWDMFTTDEALSALRRDSTAGVQAIKIEVRHPDEINSIFDPSIVYAKGGRMIRMLMEYLGQDTFRRGLKAYFAKHAYANTTGDDLWAAMSAASGQDIANFMNPWLYQNGFPVLHVQQTNESLAITQQHFLLDPAKIDKTRIWPVPLLADSDEITPLLDKPGLQQTLKSDGFIRLNLNAIGHYVVHYTDPDHAADIANKVSSKKLNEPERLMLLSDSSMLARSGAISFSETMRLLDHYAKEDSEPVWDMMSLIIADCRRFIDAEPELEGKLKDFACKLLELQYQRLGWNEVKGEPGQDTKLRATILGLGVYAEHPAITKKALELFDAYKKDPAAVESELRGIVFSAAVRHNHSDAVKFLLELDASTANVDLKNEILGSLCATRLPQIGDQLLARLTDPTKVRNQDFDHWLVYLIRNRYLQQQTWDWLRANWGWVEKTFGSDKSYDSLPRYAASAFNTRKRLQEFQEFFEPLKNHPSLVRNITMGIEEIDNRVTWLERDLPAIKTFFK